MRDLDETTLSRIVSEMLCNRWRNIPELKEMLECSVDGYGPGRTSDRVSRQMEFTIRIPKAEYMCEKSWKRPVEKIPWDPEGLMNPEAWSRHLHDAIDEITEVFQEWLTYATCAAPMLGLPHPQPRLAWPGPLTAEVSRDFCYASLVVALELWVTIIDGSQELMVLGNISHRGVGR